MHRPSDTIPTDIGKVVSTKAPYLLLFAVAGVAVFAIYPVLFSTGVDFYLGLAPTTNHWLQGLPVYSGNDIYLEMPWLLPVIAVLLWLTNRGAEAAITLLAITGIIRAWGFFLPRRETIVSRIGRYAPPLALAFCLFNLHLFDLIQRTEVDAFILLGVLLTYRGVMHHNPYLVGIGWTLVAVRPTSVWLVMIYSVWLMYRQGKLMQAFIIPIATALLSLIVFDPGWLGRWYTKLGLVEGMQTWVVTLWRAAQQLGVSPIYPTVIASIVLLITGWVMWRNRLDYRMAFAFLTTASLLTTPYALSYNYSVLMAIFIPVLVGWRVWLFLPLYLLTLTPMLRVLFGAEVAWIDIVLPLAAWALLIWKIRSDQHSDTVQEPKMILTSQNPVIESFSE